VSCVAKYENKTTAFVQAVITKCQRLGASNNRHLFLTVLEAGKSNIQVLADSVSGEALLLVCRQVLSCYNFTAGRERTLLSSSFFKDTDYIPSPQRLHPYDFIET